MVGTWSPEWCTHVESTVKGPHGTIGEEDEPLRVDMYCLVCRARWRAHCYSGQWQRRVEKFALIHKSCWFLPVPVANR